MLTRNPEAPRTRCPWKGIASLAALLLVTAARSQGAVRGPVPARPILVEARSESRAPLIGAEVRFQATLRSPLRALADGPPLQPPPAPIVAKTRARGRAAIRPTDPWPGIPGYGVLLVTHPAGQRPVLGALQVGLVRGLQMICTPMAEVQLGELAAEVHVQAVDADGHGHDLGHWTDARSLRLPAGHYRLLVRRGMHLQEHAIHLRSGARQALSAPTKADVARAPRFLTVPARRDATFVLAHRPHLALPRSKARLFLPIGETPLRIFELSPAQGLRFVTEHFVPASATALPRPARPPAAAAGTVRILSREGRDLAAQVLTIRARIADRGTDYEVRAIAQTDGEGIARYAQGNRKEDQFILVLAPGYRPESRSLPLDASTTAIRLQPSRPVPVQIFAPRGEPAAFLRVDIQSGDRDGVMDATHWTDSLGQFTLDLPPGEIRLRLRGDEVLNRPIPVMIPSQPRTLKIRARPGFVLRGIVVDATGQPAAQAVVTLRDSTGQVDLRRTTITDERGRFAIRGLPEHARLRLSASRTLGNRGEISAQIWAEPDPQVEWKLQLRSEDPVFPGRKK